MANSKTAIPLCLPDNCHWDPHTGKFSVNSKSERKNLQLVSTALQRLRAIKGPICVVSITGPCRTGKSYILSKVFDQEEVFTLGHLLDPVTMGIWMWVVPQIFTDKNGQEFTVILLDTEGINAFFDEKSDSHRIFTLAMLLASVMIYNSVDVPTSRTDHFIPKLSQHIQFLAGKSKSISDEQNFQKTFPFFIWLLRDVGQKVPPGYPTIKDYFLKKILQARSQSPSVKTQEVAESILKYFSGFEAFKLPLPSFDPDVIHNLNDETSHPKIDKFFLKGVQEFKEMLLTTLTPKHSFNEGEFVTGEALATLVEVYVNALNTPGAVPSIENAWDVFIRSKCSQATMLALQTYKEKIETQLQNMLPCISDEIREAHRKAFADCQQTFILETNSFSVKNMEKYLKELTVQTKNILCSWLNKNDNLTEEFCLDLLHKLKKSNLDPVLALLISSEGSKVSFQKITAAYSAVEQEYKEKSKGAKDVCARVFNNMHPKLQAEMKKHMAYLQQLKDYDKNLAREQAAGAGGEKEKRKIQDEFSKEDPIANKFERGTKNTEPRLATYTPQINDREVVEGAP